MPPLPFDIKNKHSYIFLILSTLTACAAPQQQSENSYRCELTKLTVCDKELESSCTDISNTDFTESVHTIFYPETLSAQNYSNNKLTKTNKLSLWQSLEKTIFIAGHGLNIDGEAMVWSGTIDRESGDMVVVSLLADLSFIVKGKCQIQ